MSQIEELVERLCPDGVTHVSLGNVVAYSTTTIDASELTETTFVGVDNLLPNKAGKTTARHGPNTARVTQFQEGDVLLGNIRPYLRKIWLADHSGGCSGDVLCIRIHDTSEISPGFLFQVLGSESFFRFFTKHSRGAKMPRGDKKEVLKYVLPVPPLEVQHEIVKILDTFTDLEAELEAELESRRQQYAYYEEELVSRSQIGPTYRLSELESQGIISLGRGKVISKKTIAALPGDYPVYSSSGAGSGEFGRYGDYLFSDERITWSIDGGGRFFYRPPHRYSITNVSGWMTVDNDIIRTRYLYYVLTAAWRHEKFDYTRKAHPSVIRDLYHISVPPLSDQDRLVRRLDTFDALVNNLTSGLPAELNARRQQYEYYRDKLLTFKELKS